MKKLHSLTLVSLLGAAVICSAPAASAKVTIQFNLGTVQRPLTGRQFETMRALAHYLDESTQEAVTVAGSGVQGRSWRTRQFLSSLDDFAKRSNSFHERMDTYDTHPWDLPREISRLDQSARRVNDTIQTTRVYSGVAEQWSQVVDVLDRMERLLAGEDVRVPAAHRRGGDYERDYGPFAGRDEHADNREHGGAFQPNQGDTITLAGPRFDQYRQLVRDLDAHADRALQIAGRMNRDDREYSQDLFLSLQHFGAAVRNLRARTEAGQLDRRELNHLVADARETDSKMRENHVFPRVWEEWRQSIDILNQISELNR